MKHALFILPVVLVLASSQSFAASWSYSCTASQEIECSAAACTLKTSAQTFSVSPTMIEYNYYDMTNLTGQPAVVSSVNGTSLSFAAQVFGKAGAIGHESNITGTINVADGSFQATFDDVNTGARMFSGTCAKQ